MPNFAAIDKILAELLASKVLHIITLVSFAALVFT